MGRSLTIAALAAVQLTASATAQDSPIVLPKETPIRLMIVSAARRPLLLAPVRCEVAADVLVDHFVLIRQGTPVDGKIFEVNSRYARTTARFAIREVVATTGRKVALRGGFDELGGESFQVGTKFYAHTTEDATFDRAALRLENASQKDLPPTTPGAIRIFTCALDDGPLVRLTIDGRALSKPCREQVYCD